MLFYHPTTYGILLGELIRRVDGRMPTQFFREEFAQPIGADFQLSLSDKADLSRVAQLRRPLEMPPLENPVVERAWTSVAPGDGMSWERCSAELPSGNGFANGRSIARVCAIMALGGELDGKRYLSREIVKRAAEEQVFAEEPYVGWLRMGLGFGLSSDSFPGPTSTAFHWGGTGGSWAVMDPQSGISMGYACSNWLMGLKKNDPRLERFSDAMGQLAAEL